MAEASAWRKWIRRALIALVALAVVALVIVAWVPNPVEVDAAKVSRGPLVVTVNEDGKTRVKDRYVISAPVTGNLARIELHAGDTIEEQQVMARLVPLPPPLLDSRTRAEAKPEHAFNATLPRRSPSARWRSSSREDWHEAMRTGLCPRIARAKRGSPLPSSVLESPNTNSS